jgi:hypothetical protein
MRTILGFGVLGLALAASPALAQSSNTSSNSSSNNGYVREQIVDRYCDGGYCERTVVRRNYWDDRSQYRRSAREGRRWQRERLRRWRGY